MQKAPDDFSEHYNRLLSTFLLRDDSNFGHIFLRDGIFQLNAAYFVIMYFVLSRSFSAVRRWVNIVLAWFDSDIPITKTHSKPWHRWVRCAPFIAIHVGCLAVFWVGVSAPAVALAVFLYFFRVFCITGFYHRYFSHRSFRTSRFWQFIFAFCTMTSAQRGPLWWASHHRHHHLHSDTEHDLHSPRAGFWRSHLGWFIDVQHYHTDYSRIGDFARYPELVFLNRYDSLVPILFFLSLYLLGEWVQPGAGWQFLVWGGFISTVAVYHATFFINSLCHIIGNKRFKSDDDSRNNLWLALVTFGEGWHNNHHRYPASVRQGFYWWEIDITYYLLRLLQVLGIIYDLRSVPDSVLKEGKEIDRQKN